MTTRRRYKPYSWQPLTMTPAEVAEVVFRRTEAWFTLHTPPGFPAPVDGLYATEAVHDWVRAHWGLVGNQDDAQAGEKRLLERAHGMGKGALPRRPAA